MFALLSYIGDFFKWLWKGITTTVAFVVSLPGLVVTSITTLYTSITAVVQVLSDGGGVVDTVVQTADGGVDKVAEVMQSAHGILNLAFYATSLDIAASVAISIITFVVTFLVSVATLVIVAVPTFLIQYYALKIGAKVLIAVMPSGWVPVQLLDWIRYDASAFLNRHSSEWGYTSDGGVWTVGK